jgi:hypothetical protein
MLINIWTPTAQIQFYSYNKSYNFWDITPCTPLKVNGRFGGTYHLQLQGKMSRARYQSENRWQAGLPPAFNITALKCWIWGSYSGDYEEFYLLGIEPRVVRWKSIDVSKEHFACHLLSRWNPVRASSTNIPEISLKAGIFSSVRFPTQGQTYPPGCLHKLRGIRRKAHNKLPTSITSRINPEYYQVVVIR